MFAMRHPVLTFSTANPVQGLVSELKMAVTQSLSPQKFKIHDFFNCPKGPSINDVGSFFRIFEPPPLSAQGTK